MPENLTQRFEEQAETHLDVCFDFQNGIEKDCNFERIDVLQSVLILRTLLNSQLAKYSMLTIYKNQDKSHNYKQIYYVL